MRIIHIATAFRRNSRDIITPWLEDLLAGQAEKHDVAVFTSGYGYTVKRQIFRNIRIERFSYAPRRMMRLTHDYTIQDYLKINRRAFLLLPVFMISGVLQFAVFAFRFKPDVIVVHWPVPLALIPLPSKKISGAKMLFVYYGAELKLLESFPDAVKKAISSVLNRADAAAAISNDTKSAAEKAGVAGRIDVIPYGIRINSEAPHQKENIIMFAGRLVERKGVKYLIEAMKMTDITYNLEIIGDGPLMQELKKYAAELGLQKRVSFRGFIPEAEKREMYRRAKVFVLPAVHDKRGETEGLGMVIVEAMSFFTPAVATGTGGITDIVEDGWNGLFSNEGDPADIAKKINQIITDDRMYAIMQKNARKTAEEKFALGSILKKYEDIYERI